MTARSVVTTSLLIIGAVALLAIGGATTVLYFRLIDQNTELVEDVVVLGATAAFLCAATIAVAWGYLDHAVGRPVIGITRGLETIVHANPHYRIEVEEGHAVGGLLSAAHQLVDQLAEARTRVNETVADATKRVEHQKRQLEIILNDLSEGVVVCSVGHTILLYNKRALQLLQVGDHLGLDRSLFAFIDRQPILHALSRLTNRLGDTGTNDMIEELTVPFVCATADGRVTLQGRMSLIRADDAAMSGYVLSFQDRTQELAALGLRDRLLREATEGQLGTIANLRAATEILSAHGDMPMEAQAKFLHVVDSETEVLSSRIEDLAAQYREVATGRWPTTDIYSASVVSILVQRLREDGRLEAVMTGLPQWCHGDSYTLVELLDRLVRQVNAYTGATVFDLDTSAGERHIYIDIVYSGEPVPPATLDAWLAEPLAASLGGLTPREVLERHHTDVWSLPDRADRARLRVPLPPARHPPRSAEERRPPARPEFYDFDLLKRTPDLGQLGNRPLKSLTYVAFDTETTGLQPSAGDEVIAVAGVRIVNGRILTGESFERIVDPQRVIPRESIQFHGITEDMVKDKPPIQVVLPQFRDFVGDAVLVAHNAAFDLRFFRLKEAETGIVFDMPVLDTLLLSAFVHDHAARHDLDAVANRFGVVIRGRHTALGDALMTAAIFLRMIVVLEARGVTTLQEAVEAGNRIIEIRAQQARF